MFQYTFKPTHTLNGVPVQRWHSWKVASGGEAASQVVIYECYDSDGRKYTGRASNFQPI